MPAATAVKAVTVSDDPQVYEDEHVHSVYDEIAPHFSSTRYKPWPIIAQFLSSLPTGWVGLDSGTGNGKYLPLPQDRPGSVWTVGLDRSRNLLEIAQNAGGIQREVVWGNVLEIPWRAGAFDYAISIATIHHLSTPARRKLAVQRLIESISPAHGRALVYVWAIEQDELSKRSIPTECSTNNPVTDSAKGKDVFVPWVLSSRSASEEKSKIPTSHDATAEANKVFNRYYHMFAQGELRQLVEEAARDLGLLIGSAGEGKGGDGDVPVRGLEIAQDGWERSNYFVEVRRWQSIS
ncbi:S-adenosyl-L-methionine-dependent methyltransferase [Rhodofomes roseus]|uniref:S-adenosyl-L-methionine-dependent methyltransferase n=1 Tax=Rhodofomes roseus TaxID=34475 RepID=A0ABQ8KU23_9APHY|nr:S-adenosyl-L-methionine-dependent methyltransferase [Rhodofomes roseus]KAH9842582.1 S-adenosyl-L-methionine-dependent methyltransferase [Rhodofomes roseus]